MKEPNLKEFLKYCNFEMTEFQKQLAGSIFSFRVINLSDREYSARAIVIKYIIKYLKKEYPELEQMTISIECLGRLNKQFNERDNV